MCTTILAQDVACNRFMKVVVTCKHFAAYGTLFKGVNDNYCDTQYGVIKFEVCLRINGQLAEGFFKNLEA